MRKNLFIVMAIMLLTSNICCAEQFDNIEGITPIQMQQLSQITLNYKQEYNEIEQKIIDYNTKIARLKNENEKTEAEIALLKNAYERNINALKEQQTELEANVDSLYKSVFTQEQYKKFKEQKEQTENAFSNFLQK